MTDREKEVKKILEQSVSLTTGESRYISEDHQRYLTAEICQLFEPRWVCEDCRFKGNIDQCLCPAMYPDKEYSLEAGLHIVCSKSFTSCKYFEPTPNKETEIRADERAKTLDFLEKEYPSITTWRCWEALRKGVYHE